MLLLEISVPAIGKNYDFHLDENAPVADLVEEIAEMVCQKEQCRLAGDAEALQLWSVGRRQPLPTGGTLAGYGVHNGELLLFL